ncbi:peptidoglycan DD-metalloendopeptidase family protein [Streptomyces sp. HU2014]|uniref:M23 family metallopeptidase n=1 Tax=Streptomyces sp. HU2014 TaxID=2939414 RepID=UPI00200DA133|nr:M23 family metallopeptidase [Streptomyces sp. HU2014]UQI48309.1 peptidoglycan DD-metalloendopeptidase family protein [Streptomyces sp. HU2014]
MNDRHPSAGSSPTGPAQDVSYGHYASYEQQSAQPGYPGYDGYDTGQWASGQWDTTNQWGVTGQTQIWDFSGYDTGQHTGQHTGQWDTSGGHPDTSAIPAQNQGGQDQGQWQSGSWDTGSWDTSGSTGAYDTSGQWDTSGAHAQSWDTSGHGGHSGQYPAWDQSTGTGWGDLSAQQTQTWDTSAYAAMDAMDDQRPEAQHTPTLMVDLSGVDLDQPAPASPGAAAVAAAETRTMSVVDPMDLLEQTAPEDGAAGGSCPPGADVPGPARSRRKGAPARTGYRPRRKALLTVAVPSVAVMGVAGIAAASVSGGGDDAKKPQAASVPDTSGVPKLANSKLDTQLAGLSHGADDFASRANRTQERIDLKARQEAEKKRKAEEAARKEAERPKFSLPVAQHGLSAYYGQAGVNWMSVHTGIDFPVSYGTPVMAATDGTVRTQYNVAYGNMAIVTSPEGVETWYCHLSSTKLRSGQVKAGDVIAYSGNSGNSTGPHLHFEVRPGGSAVDPLPWLRGRGFDPT